MKEDQIVTTGTIIETLPSTVFKVKLNEIDSIITCTLSGKLRLNSINVTNGDLVEVTMSPYDLTKGRITFRLKN
jgi:translation initiation factor IF-1